MVLKNLFIGQQWRNRHREQTYGHGEERRGMNLISKDQMFNWRCPYSKILHKLSLMVVITFVCCLVAKLCLGPYNPIDCRLPGFSADGISQSRVLEWVAISFSRGFSQLRDQTWVSHIAGRFFTF